MESTSGSVFEMFLQHTQRITLSVCGIQDWTQSWILDWVQDWILDWIQSWIQSWIQDWVQWLSHFVVFGCPMLHLLQ